MKKEDKAFLIALAYATTQPQDITPEEFLSEVERSEVDFLALINKRDSDESLRIWEKLGSSK